MHSLEDVVCVLPVGGLGTRLHSFTSGKPKCFVDLSGRQLLDRNLDTLIQVGIRRFLFCGVGDHANFQDVADSLVLRGCKANLIFEADRTGNMGAFLSDGSPFTETHILVCFGDVLVERKTIETLLATHDGSVERVGWLFSRYADNKFKHRFTYDEDTSDIKYIGKESYSDRSISPVGMIFASFRCLLEYNSRFDGNDFLYTVLLPLVSESSGTLIPCVVDYEVVDINEPVDLVAALTRVSSQDSNSM